MSKIRFSDLKGKILLIGLTYYGEDGNITEQVQYWGTVVKADKEIITIRRANGELFSIPPDLSAIEPADKGEYRLNSTGEIVVDPDYVSSWSIHLNREEK